jgi:hypothetical protein
MANPLFCLSLTWRNKMRRKDTTRILSIPGRCRRVLRAKRFSTLSATAINGFGMKSFLILCLLSFLVIGCAGQKKGSEAYPYSRPLSSPGQKFSGLPPAVQSTVRAQAGAAQIHDILKRTNGNQVVYEILFQETNLFPPLYIAPDGSVLRPESHAVAVGAGGEDIGARSGGAASGLKLGDLPINVVNVIQQKAPTAEVAYINRITRNKYAFYEITFKDSAGNPKLLIAEDGTIVTEP